eukprot:1158458-Pelagomonas_calceolata.AAC.11
MGQDKRSPQSMTTKPVNKNRNFWHEARKEEHLVQEKRGRCAYKTTPGFDARMHEAPASLPVCLLPALIRTDECQACYQEATTKSAS